MGVLVSSRRLDKLAGLVLYSQGRGRPKNWCPKTDFITDLSWDLLWPNHAIPCLTGSTAGPSSLAGSPGRSVRGAFEGGIQGFTSKSEGVSPSKMDEHGVDHAKYGHRSY